VTSVDSVHRDKVETEARAKTFWGVSREDILKDFLKEGIDESEATSLVQGMFQERADTIRGMGMKKIFAGLSLISVGIVTWFLIGKLHFIPAKLFFIPACCGVYGAYSALNGSIMYISPNSETGDISEK